ncbi:MAG: Glutamate--cysteine ligase [candidate division WS2 bacterium]|uniref:Glutamate--cysteine ligase n=1 Tax=Psychracetigena formicireducens TaxID=2986056 RepID=A0A9E2BIP1_PSYF1|nr:Glutamate--cysteine ligase [Candidatus Psychracetigena formicireducens]MBT9145281.1 Glutamate--cysteine ligase [Candidatus Psychracetigena formicireducens]MBT9150318.1 Glutamate--cysteine ligase [Candidatus Psychracetigena formicireducens]
MKIIWGLEEEVFIVENNGRTSLDSLYYLYQLLRKNHKFYYCHSASNFSRGKDIVLGLMSGIEISTDVQLSVNGLLEDLKARRTDLIKVVDNGMILPIGHLLDTDTPTNTCGLHIHLGVEKKYREAVYQRIAHYLPLIALASTNSPGRNGLYFGKSYRMESSYAVGPLSNNPYFRFQDLIIAKRLKTVEIRVLDPFPQLDRLEKVLKLIEDVARGAQVREVNISHYLKLRNLVAKEGFTKEIETLFVQLQRELGWKDKELFITTPSDLTWKAYEEKGLLGAYLLLDEMYRGELRRTVKDKKYYWKPLFLRSLMGIAGYYVPRLPYVVYKALKEN